ncbi:MAG: hypothetical protein ACFHVJ_11265 [Aestuariibacter sp.]
MSTYQIIDEPQGSRLSKATVDPMWPLFGFMLGGALFSWLWSVINSVALNSPCRNRELVVVSMAFSVFIAMYMSLGLLIANGSLEGINIQYIKMAIVSIELIFCYKLFLMQRNSFDVYEYFNREAASPVIGLLVAFMVGRKVEAFAIGTLLAGMG